MMMVIFMFLLWSYRYSDNFGESIYIPIFPSLPSTSINEGIEQLSISKYNLLVKTTNNNDGDFRSSYQ